MSARTVAEWGKSSIRLISPIWSPGYRVAKITSCPSRSAATTRARPLTRTNSASVFLPCSTIVSPRLKRRLTTASANAAICSSVSIANSGARRISSRFVNIIMRINLLPVWWLLQSLFSNLREPPLSRGKYRIFGNRLCGDAG